MDIPGAVMPRVDLARLRTDCVGSLLRPERLRSAYDDFRAGRIDDAARIAAEDIAISDVIRLQEAHGVAVVNDGEFRRVVFADSFADVAGVLGWRKRWGTKKDLDAVGAPADPALAIRAGVTERLALRRNRPLEEYAFVAARTSSPATVTLLGPDRVLQGISIEESAGVYDDAAEVAADVASTLSDMVAGLRAAGCAYVHIDEPGFTSYIDEANLAAIAERGEDPQVLLQRSIRAGNALFDAFRDVVFGVHICRGNRRSRWHREGHYDAIAEQLFGTLRCQRLLLEYDTERAGSFAPLRFVRPETIAVLGLISTKTGELESVDTLLRRIDEATTYLPIDQLAISPQCGFASAIEGNLLTIDDQWRKIDLMNEVAARVWGGEDRSSAPATNTPTS